MDKAPRKYLNRKGYGVTISNVSEDFLNDLCYNLTRQYQTRKAAFASVGVELPELGTKTSIKLTYKTSDGMGTFFRDVIKDAWIVGMNTKDQIFLKVAGEALFWVFSMGHIEEGFEKFGGAL